MEIKLSIGTVELIEKMTWGMQEAINTAMFGGFEISSGLSEKDKQNFKLNPAVLSTAKYKAIEICVKKITLNDGTEVKYSKEWMDGLSIEDGDKLFDAVNEITSPKKK